MFDSISCKNYKAFESFSLELKPLTILLGANSFGKSSILNLILMLTQTINSNELSDSPIRINGSHVGFGEAENVIRNMDDENVLSISIKSKNENEKLISNIVDNSFDEFRYVLHRYVFDNENIDRLSSEFVFDDAESLGFDKLSNYVLKKLKMLRSDLDDRLKDRVKNNPSNVNDYILNSKF